MPEKWIKEDPTVTSDRRIVCYNNSMNPNVIEKIQIVKHKSEEISLGVFSPSGVSKDARAKALRDQLGAAGFKQEETRWFRIRHKDTLSLEDTELFIKFLSIVKEYEVINDEIYYDILHEIGINKPSASSDKYQKLALSLDAAITNGDQRLVDQFFHQLCGREDTQPTFSNMKGDTHTLITLANHIRTMEEQLKKFEVQPSQLTKPSFFS